MELCRQLFVAFTALLLGFGLLMVHSASITSWPTQFEQVYLSKHLTFLMFGLALAAFAASRTPDFWKRFAPGLFAITMILLVLVLIPGIGVRVKGAQRWIRIPGFSAQPSELAKIAVPLMMCWMIDRKSEHLNRWISGTFPFALPILFSVPGNSRLSARRCRAGFVCRGMAPEKFSVWIAAGCARRIGHFGHETLSATTNHRLSSVMGQF